MCRDGSLRCTRLAMNAGYLCCRTSSVGKCRCGLLIRFRKHADRFLDAAPEPLDRCLKVLCLQAMRGGDNGAKCTIAAIANILGKSCLLDQSTKQDGWPRLVLVAAVFPSRLPVFCTKLCVLVRRREVVLLARPFTPNLPTNPSITTVLTRSVETM